MEKTTQRDLVLKYCRDFGSITTWDAFKDLGITRLSAIVFILKERGYIVTKERKQSINRYGKPVHYDKFTIKENPCTS